MKQATRPFIFKWRQTAPELILCAVRWYLRYSLSLRDVEELLAERGLAADHTTIWRWVQRYGPELEQRLRRQLKPTNQSWRLIREQPVDLDVLQLPVGVLVETADTDIPYALTLHMALKKLKLSFTGEDYRTGVISPDNRIRIDLAALSAILRSPVDKEEQCVKGLLA